ncbi:MAG: asparagine synthase (glutamine-hydrolyzing) [Methanobacteriales archaeon HGW-Methanobacteriales-1]|jgi:asparagine synthase (glutamine-hydrolysing)|nr:MAG: asparagine synthase (glutamine-hydrolyzing) [Methanobacteriales archaeon HGW-Methanobacteriales-1]
MCGIVGIVGDNISNDLKEMLDLLKHRGPDDSGLWINNQLIHGDISQTITPEGNFGLGHNLLSIVGCHGLQPITNGHWVLVCNGEIYNFQEIKESIKISSKNDFKTDSDCEIAINLNKYFMEILMEKNGLDLNFKDNSKKNDCIDYRTEVLYKKILVDSLKKTMQKIDGDYAFAIYDGKNLALARDPVGVKPLYYGEIKGKIRAFASERKALWKVGIKEVHSLPPGHMLFNDELILAESLFDLKDPTTIHNQNNAYKINNNNLLIESSNHLIDSLKGPDLKEYSLKSLKNELKNVLEKSVDKRIQGLDKVGLVFSGGVDSTILASILKNRDIETTLYTVGTKNSSDFQFANRAAEYYDLKLKTFEINEKIIKNSLRPVLEAIEEFNVMKIGVALPIFLAAKMASADKLKVVLSGQGADELFGGYHRYLKDYSNYGEGTQEVLKQDIKNIYHVNLQRDDAATMAHGVELRVPFLDKEVIKTAFRIPIKYKIQSESDKLRKHILREVAGEMGVPDFIENRPKKAAQYGSGVHKILIKKVLKDFDEVAFMKQLRGF